jgi:hypothetical protein
VLIADEDAALLEGPSSLIVGTVDETGLPDATKAWGVVVLPDREHMRVVLSADEDVALANARSTRVFALTATDVDTFVSVQIKGRVESVEPESDADRARREQQIEGFKCAVNQTDGTPIELLARIEPCGFVTVVATIEEAFDQTPGPTAGRRREPAPS